MLAIIPAASRPLVCRITRLFCNPRPGRSSVKMSALFKGPRREAEEDWNRF